MAQCMVRLLRQQRQDSDVLRMVEQCGMEVDHEFGVVQLDQTGEMVLVRGQVDEEAARNLAKLNAEIFPDLGIGPLRSNKE